MKLRHVLQESAQSLRTNKLRSSLTIVGIVVGIFAVSAMLALGEGLSENVVSRISSFSQGDISVQGELTLQDLRWMQEQPYIKGVLGSLSIGDADIVVEDSEYAVSVKSVVGDFSAVQQFSVVKGDVFDFSNTEFMENVAVLTSDLEELVQKEVGKSLVNEYVTIGGQRFQVVGVIDMESAGFSRTDGSVYVPYARAIGVLTGTRNFSTIGASLTDSSYYEIAGKNVLEGLNASRYVSLDSSDLFTVSTAQSMIESAEETVGMISMFLGIVGGIALFVGGIGTMNMMLTTVTERTKEIGLRKAIGARRKDILVQFLFESVFLTSIGGVLGITLTVLGSYFANTVFADSNIISVIVSANVVILSTFVAVFVGIIFGLYPANKASKLMPVDALRTE